MDINNIVSMTKHISEIMLNIENMQVEIDVKKAEIEQWQAQVESLKQEIVQEVTGKGEDTSAPPSRLAIAHTAKHSGRARGSNTEAGILKLLESRATPVHAGVLKDRLRVSFGHLYEVLARMVSQKRIAKVGRGLYSRRVLVGPGSAPSNGPGRYAVSGHAAQIMHLERLHERKSKVNYSQQAPKNGLGLKLLNLLQAAKSPMSLQAISAKVGVKAMAVAGSLGSLKRKNLISVPAHGTFQARS